MTLLEGTDIFGFARGRLRRSHPMVGSAVERSVQTAFARPRSLVGRCGASRTVREGVPSVPVFGVSVSSEGAGVSKGCLWVLTTGVVRAGRG